MKPNLFFLVLLFFIANQNVKSQIIPELSAVSFTDRLKQILIEYDTCHYTAEMLFKEMGGNTFEVRNFSVSLRGNPTNKLYGYNWLVSENDQEGFTSTILINADKLYSIYEGNKLIGHRPLPSVLEMSSYQEMLRTYLLLGEVLTPFVDIDPGSLPVVDSNNLIYVKKWTNESANSEIAF